MEDKQRYVYLIESTCYPGWRYIGITYNVHRRLTEHNGGFPLGKTADLGGTEMTTRTAETSPLVYATVAGFLYLIMFIVAIFGLEYVPSKIIVPGDATATADNIMTSESLFRIGIVSP